jgi:hypothetical protein
VNIGVRHWTLAAAVVAAGIVAGCGSDAAGTGPNPSPLAGLAAGALYIVTITPPSGSKYQGVWVAAIAHSHSGDYPWWVVLPLK